MTIKVKELKNHNNQKSRSVFWLNQQSRDRFRSLGPYGDPRPSMRYSVGFKNGQKRAKKKLQCKKMNRNEQNSQTKSVFWLVAEKIHKLRGISPGVPWGYFRSQEGVKTPKQTQKTTF